MWRVSAPHLWLGFEDYSDRNHAVCSKLCNVWQLLEEPPVITTAANLEKLKLGAGQSTDGNYFLDFCMILFRLPGTFFFLWLGPFPKILQVLLGSSLCFLALDQEVVATDQRAAHCPGGASWLHRPKG